ncbi:rhomboid family intramembrane serine protease [Puniceicoccales bacterium CK1056]|uniref:Rhomboid family intramembrane serine protease n=1 Tax=Oceanipulchritudo coccoides TaxID=2706888 RepID=A0A6B2M0L5_9BACT|nr:rhomboid family intramembrane serine protease [Oceanipulchritudo coccoides]NDV61315.1 rhomboid family intramembrane serine protease [Oceanipulchritudo coccoides]
MKSRLKIDYNAPYCLSFAILAMVVYVANTLSGGWALGHWFSIPGSASLGDWTTYPRLFLHVLGHGSAQHLFSNIIVFLLVGPMLEEMYGPTMLIVLSLITALITGLIMIFFFSGALAGASGIVFALIILSSFANAKSGTIPLTFVLISLIFLGGEVIRALSGVDQIAQFAHIAGGVLGGFAGFLIAKRVETPRW